MFNHLQDQTLDIQYVDVFSLGFEKQSSLEKVYLGENKTQHLHSNSQV